jgi:hypothetical protein
MLVMMIKIIEFCIINLLTQQHKATHSDSTRTREKYTNNELLKKTHGESIIGKHIKTSLIILQLFKENCF